MAYANGQDVTADVDLTSDLDGTDGGYTPNNGTTNVPAGTRVAGSDASSVQTPAEAKPQREATPPEKGTSIRDALSSAFKTSTGTTTDQQAAQSAPTDAQGRARNPDGTFAPVPSQEGQQPALDGQQGQQPQTFAAPQGLPPAVAQQFATLPAEVQQFVASTMERETQNMQRYAGYDALEQVIGSRRQAWAMNGMAPEQAVNQVLALSDFAGQDPEGFISWFAGQQGIDLGVLAEGAPAVDPQFQALQNELAGVRSQLAQFTQGQQTATQSALVNEVATFASEKDQSNQLLRPYFEEIGTGITPYIQQVRAENPNLSNRDVLSQAYDRACWGTPGVRAKLLADQEARRLTDATGAAARARAAGSSVTGAPASGASAPNNTGDGSIRGILQAQLASA